MEKNQCLPIAWCFRKRFLLLIVLSLGLFASCAARNSIRPAADTLAISATADGTLPAQLSPVFVIEHPEESFNPIGTPRVEMTDKLTQRVYVDPLTPTIYYEARNFQTTRSAYRNLIFRVHFEQVPLKLFPFYLVAGKNVGLFVVVTLDARDRPILYTLVHTCGCYLAFIPTSYMPADAFPGVWDKDRQRVYSENLPGMLRYPHPFDGKTRLVITLRHGTHRVKNVRLSDMASPGSPRESTAALSPMASLETLCLENGGSTSFFETSGPRRGYVKSSTKIWERIFMGWWAFDWRVGEDKKLGDNRDDGILFYTSLVPWKKEASDMREFSTFLKFWGWNL